MVIQRWQSLFLLVAAALMAIFAFTPFATIEGAPVASTAYPAFMALNLLCALLLLINIFLFKNLKFQIKQALLNSFLVLGSICCAAVITFTTGASLSWQIALPVVALIFSLFARRRMCADKRLLDSADRIR
ncbi:MAG: DUF4293 family protein [Muribaculaceae bacterium]|nr:DUF4293 family protein [Muribaculaceae bacterium]